MKNRLLASGFRPLVSCLCLLASVLCLPSHAGRAVFPGYDWQVIAWNTRCNTNAGVVKPSTLLAATVFMRDVRGYGLYPGTLLRVNLFAGVTIPDVSLNMNSAVNVPLIIDKGAAIDTNVGGKQAVYTEQGSSGGLSFAATSGFLDTGVIPSTDFSTINSVHEAVYVTVGNNEAGMCIGAQGPSVTGNQSMYLMPGWVDGHFYTAICNESAYAQAACNVNVGWFVGTRDNIIPMGSYTNGVAFAGSSGASGILPTNSIFIFARHAVTPNVDSFSTKTLGAYSLGTLLSASSQTNYNVAMQRFQTALGRNK